MKISFCQLNEKKKKLNIDIENKILKVSKRNLSPPEAVVEPTEKFKVRPKIWICYVLSEARNARLP